jgi:anti-sigma regulatory factor (Ser/Thr protein kinase)
MISIDDIITAFDRGRIDEPVAEYMTRNVVTVPQNYSVIAAANIFDQYHYGRLPVVEAPQSRTVVGLITYSDIISYLVMVINSIAERFERQEQATLGEGGAVKNRLRFELAPDNFDLAGTASTAIKKYLQDGGVPPAIVRRVAVICYEAEMNVIIHSLGGYLEVQMLDDRIKILVVDEGPGIPDVDKAMMPGFTTASEKIRSLGFGAGMGLCNMKRCADEFTIRSSMESGTEVEAVVRLTPQERTAAEAPSNAGQSAGAGNP